MATPSALLKAAGLEANRLPALLASARRAASALQFGVHGLRKAGPGETFWQHRDHRPEEGLAAVDWRRSARSDRLYVREREREAPARIGLWADGRASMQWASSSALPSKADAALIGVLALGLALQAGGERVGALNARPRGQSINFLSDLIAEAARSPDFRSVRSSHGLILATDGLEPMATWNANFASLKGSDAPRILILTSDPMEESFDYQGHIAFDSVGGQHERVILGRAEAVSERYKHAWQSHRKAFIGAAKAAGFTCFALRTDTPITPLLLEVARTMRGIAR